jgi:WhiB family redox-sensing transcriptional regulator
VTDARWHPKAACRNHPGNWWFPERAKGQDNHAAAAIAVCTDCPVREPCLRESVNVNEEFAILGGAGEARRRVLRRAKADSDQVYDATIAAHFRDLDRKPVVGDRELLSGVGVHATHGLPVTYARGCRCAACSMAAAFRGAGAV